MDSSVLSNTAVYTARKLTRRWEDLCAQYLPVAPEGSIWRYNRSPDPEMRAQGWKLHVSATILNAHKILAKIAPLLVTHELQFKAPSSLQEVAQLNSGVHYSYSQVGKVITVYPHSDEQAVSLARHLDELTRRFVGPAIPFDNRLRPGSNVYYRYGAFRAMEIAAADGGKIPALKDQRGNLVPDLYLTGSAKPEWVQDPFVGKARQRVVEADNPFQHSFRVFQALSQRGKGGVYQAFDMTVQPPRLCLLKEGRKAGEMGWEGRDGRWRVAHERVALTTLRGRGVDVPRIYS